MLTYYKGLRGVLDSYSSCTHDLHYVPLFPKCRHVFFQDFILQLKNNHERKRTKSFTDSICSFLSRTSHFIYYIHCTLCEQYLSVSLLT